MNDAHANRGFKKCSGTSPINLASSPLQGFTPINGDVVFAALTLPATRGSASYTGVAASLVGDTFLEGVYYPLPLTGCTLTSGSFIGWLD
ncbi:hypothetical protein [Prosthecobacter dejongeii]|uniref:Uncharacterized protein n=1 Tax=Prosthecobacter dejongeii TaxID=48465 RepID=A0A7W7YJU4_9BACT|nr:hypothetical protein [Prosthecobacter dejongeii]MBB5037439.1 hypothetical protein [Prosthecobacter dejongeii]